jgi:PKD repeat protein
MTMEQCNSGGFVANFIPTTGTQKRVIATAANSNEASIGNDFSSWWIKGVGGPANEIANGGDGNNLISLEEAFNYAKGNDPSAQGSTPLENPQYGKYTADAGKTLGLSSCSVCPAATAVPGGIGTPTDTTNPKDGLYEDVNGNNVFDKNDAVLFFQQMDYIANPANEPVCAFDFNGNGRIDFGDIVKLYTMAP